MVCSTRPCRSGRCINLYLQSKRFYGAAVYHQRSIAVFRQQSKTKAKALLDDTDVSTRPVYQARMAEQSIFGAAAYHQRGIAISAASKSKTKAFLDDTTMTRVVSAAISKAKTYPGTNVYRQRGISTAISTAEYYLTCSSTATKF